MNEVKDASMEKKMGKYDKWEIERAADTLQEAMEIKKDKDKMVQVKKILKQRISSLEDLRAIANGDYEDDEE